MTTSERVIALASRLGIDVPADARPYRTYAGWAQKSVGAWSWALTSHESPSFSLGSQWPMTVILSAPGVVWSINEFGQIALDPYPFPKWKKYDSSGRRRPYWDLSPDARA